MTFEELNSKLIDSKDLKNYQIEDYIEKLQNLINKKLVIISKDNTIMISDDWKDLHKSSEELNGIFKNNLILNVLSVVAL